MTKRVVQIDDATDGQVATWDAATHSWKGAAAPGGGGGASAHGDLTGVGVSDHHVRYTDTEAKSAAARDYASFYLGATGGLTGMSNTAVTLVINATSVNSDTDVFDLTASVVTVDKAGDFKVEMDAYLNNSATSRSEFSSWLEQDSGGGYTEVPGTRKANYLRGYDSGDTASAALIIPVASGDKFRVRAQRTDGGSTAGYQDPNGTRLTFTEMG